MLIRRIASIAGRAALILCAALASAQSPKPLTAASTAAEPPGVTFNGGQLRIVGDGETLNQILSEIVGRTGMRVLGPIPDERVYGTYGPASPAVVLAGLLQGTGTNMLMRQPSSGAPGILVLSVRTGEATPPSEPTPGTQDQAHAAAMGIFARPGRPIALVPLARPATDPNSGDDTDTPNRLAAPTPEQQAAQLKQAQQRQKDLLQLRRSTTPQ